MASGKRTCSVESCEGPVIARGLCRNHYQQKWSAARALMMPRCSVNGCAEPSKTRGLCNKHYLKLWQYGDPLAGTVRAPNGSGRIRSDGYKTFTIDYAGKLEHVLVAERAFGKPLPPAAIVHHNDRNRANNDPGNLVICPDDAYHQLLHRRMRAIDGCGHPDWVKCRFCQQWDEPSNLYISPGKHHGHHRSCRASHRRQTAASF